MTEHVGSEFFLVYLRESGLIFPWCLPRKTIAVQHIADEAEAFLLLESFGAAEFDYTIHHARFLRSPEHVAFLLFCPEGNSKGAQIFLFENPPVAGEIENGLLNAVLQIGGDEHADMLRELASETIREFLETKSAGHYFFDAH